MVSLHVSGTLSIPKATTLPEYNVKVDRGVNISYFSPSSDSWSHKVMNSDTLL